MAIRNELKILNESAPNWAAMYAYAQLCRIAAYGNVSLLEQWARWAGADAWQILPRNDMLLSGVALVKDDEQGIVAYGGTKNPGQLIGQITGAVQVADSDMEGRCSAFHLWYYRQRQTLIEAFFSDLIVGHLLISVGHSLGGSVAMIHAAIAEKTGKSTLNGLVTFGQPRTGNNPFGTQIRCPYIRVVRVGDPVPHVPPPFVIQGGYVLIATVGFFSYYYFHMTDAWEIATGVLPVRKTDIPSLVTENIADLVSASDQLLLGQPSIIVNHELASYATNLRAYAS